MDGAVVHLSRGALICFPFFTMENNGYSVMSVTMSGNLVGRVLAPKGTESLRPIERLPHWIVTIEPNSEELMDAEGVQEDDLEALESAIMAYLEREGMLTAQKVKDSMNTR